MAFALKRKILSEVDASYVNNLTSSSDWKFEA